MINAEETGVWTCPIEDCDLRVNSIEQDSFMVVKGSFPALMLAPVNFDALYQQAQQQQAKEAEQPNA